MRLSAPAGSPVVGLLIGPGTVPPFPPFPGTLSGSERSLGVTVHVGRGSGSDPPPLRLRRGGAEVSSRSSRSAHVNGYHLARAKARAKRCESLSREIMPDFSFVISLGGITG